MKKYVMTICLLFALMSGGCGSGNDMENGALREGVQATDEELQKPEVKNEGGETEYAYPIEEAVNDEAFCRIIEGKDIPVNLIYGLGGESGYVTSDSSDKAVIDGFIEAFRSLTIKEVITDPDKMSYVADGGEDIIFVMNDGSRVNITLDGRLYVHANGAVYVLDDTDKLTEQCVMMMDIAYMNENAGN